MSTWWVGEVSGCGLLSNGLFVARVTRMLTIRLETITSWRSLSGTRYAVQLNTRISGKQLDPLIRVGEHY